ncbi:MAG: hypothetical protein AAB809_00680, partial [Patescibacteria group bacterium]
MAPCLTDYLKVLPVDPQNGSWTSPTVYNTDYTVLLVSATTGQVTIAAPSAEGITISVTR